MAWINLIHMKTDKSFMSVQYTLQIYFLGKRPPDSEVVGVSKFSADLSMREQCSLFTVTSIYATPAPDIYYRFVSHQFHPTLMYRDFTINSTNRCTFLYRYTLIFIVKIRSHSASDIESWYRRSPPQWLY